MRTKKNLPAPADSLDEIDRDLQEWLEKDADDVAEVRDSLRQQEMEVWQRWRQTPNAEDFSWLYNSHQPLINSVASRYVKTSNLPPAAVKSQILQRYIGAIEGYDPNRGAQLHSHVYNSLGQKMDRYLQRYSNVGRIPEDRSWLIGTLKQREAELSDSLGRPPSDAELADDVLISMPDLSHLRRNQVTPKMVGTLRRELRKDFMAEGAGHEFFTHGRSRLEQQAVFLHGSLSPEQQLVLEHTFDGFGKPVIEDVDQLATAINMSPQKVRAIKKQIEKKLDYYYRQSNVK